MPDRYSWGDLPAGGQIDVHALPDGDVEVPVTDSDGREARIYMGWRQTLDVAAKLIMAAREAELMEAAIRRGDAG